MADLVGGFAKYPHVLRLLLLLLLMLMMTMMMTTLMLMPTMLKVMIMMTRVLFFPLGPYRLARPCMFERVPGRCKKSWLCAP